MHTHALTDTCEIKQQEKSDVQQTRLKIYLSYACTHVITYECMNYLKNKQFIIVEIMFSY